MYYIINIHIYNYYFLLKKNRYKFYKIIYIKYNYRLNYRLNFIL